MKRASYREAVKWIAHNDEAGIGDDAFKVAPVSELVTTSLIADLFAVDAEKVARDIIRLRLAERD